MWRWGALLVIGVLLLNSAPTFAAQPTNKGLFVTPSRQYLTAPINAATQESLTLANLTDAPLTINLSVQQFSVADYTYNYRFTQPQDNWLTLGTSGIQLDPGKSQKVNYSVAPPKNATPGGHYFTIFATATMQSSGNKSQIQAATVVYVTVPGALQITSSVQKTAVPRFAFGDIPFTLQVKDTGNTHFFIYVSGRLNGLGTQATSPETTHLLLPQAIRQVGDTIPAPMWPGVYTAVFGYRTDDGQTTHLTSHIIYLPLWFLALCVGLLWLGLLLLHRWRHRKFTGSSPRQYT